MNVVRVCLVLAQPMAVRPASHPPLPTRIMENLGANSLGTVNVTSFSDEPAASRHGKEVPTADSCIAKVAATERQHSCGYLKLHPFGNLDPRANHLRRFLSLACRHPG